MGRKNRYSGVLRPLQVGKGSPEVALVLIYDIENDRVRTRVSEICLDYGLERIQFSAFFGKLNRNRRRLKRSTTRWSWGCGTISTRAGFRRWP